MHDSADQKEPLETPREQDGTLYIKQQRPSVDNSYSSNRDIESQEIQNRPTRPVIRAGMHFHFRLFKPVLILGKSLIKPFYPPSTKKARRFVALTTIAAASTAVTLLEMAGHSVSEISTSVIAISALGTVGYNALADSSTPLQESLADSPTPLQD